MKFFLLYAVSLFLVLSVGCHSQDEPTLLQKSEDIINDLRELVQESEFVVELQDPKRNVEGWPYVGDKCCNLSTTSKCLKKGGECIPRNDTCFGNVYLGRKYCDFNKLESCQCCVPPNCETLNLCKLLNGTCNVTCDGRSVSGNEFCKDSKFCKCCLPEEPQDCPCGQDTNGGCHGQFLTGKWAFGHCEKNCTNDTYPLKDHSCNKTGGEDCNCCASLMAPPTIDSSSTGSSSTYISTLEPSTFPDRSMPAGCPGGDFMTGNTSYQLVFTLGFEDAQKRCAAENGFLAEPQNPVAVRISLSETCDMEESIWLGGRGNGSNIIWQHDNSVLSNTSPYWRPRYPGNGVTTNHCLSMMLRPWFVANEPTQPYDVSNCDLHSYGLCELF